MKKLYYATFELGYEELVKQVIKKQDKNSQIKKLFSDAVLFFADEHFKFENNCFKQSYLVIDNLQKEGVGALNAEMKHFLEKTGVKIIFPKETKTFKLSFVKENEKVNIDANLKKAVEITLKKITKKAISYVSTEAELVFLAKTDGTNLFMKKLYSYTQNSKLANIPSLSESEAYFINFLSEPSAGEVVLDPYAGDGLLIWLRARNFKKSNVIANSTDKSQVDNLKKLARKLDGKSLSVLNYDFLNDSFPIKFIDKIVTNLSELAYDRSFRPYEFYAEFFDKLYNLKIKIAVVVVSKSHDISRFLENKFEIDRQIFTKNHNVYKIKLQA